MIRYTTADRILQEDLLPDRDKLRCAEHVAEALAVDHRGLESGQVEILRQRIVLVADVALEPGDFERAGLVNLSAVLRRGMAGQVDVEIRAVLHPKVLETEEALAIGKLENDGLPFAFMQEIQCTERPSPQYYRCGRAAHAAGRAVLGERVCGRKTFVDSPVEKQRRAEIPRHG